MEGSIAFPLSVKAAEPAICAWAALFAAATGAPLPPLPVMVAALLRRPQLDVFIAAVASAAAIPQPLDSTPWSDDSIVAPRERERLVRRHDAAGLSQWLTQPEHTSGSRRSFVLRRLAASGDVARAFDAMQAVNVDPAEYFLNRSSMRETDIFIVHRAVASMLIVNGDAEGLAACLGAGLLNQKSYFNTGSTGERLLASRLLPASMADVVITLFDLRETKCEGFMAEAQTQCIPQARAARAALQAQLPSLGDVANLMAQLPLRPEPHHWQRLVAAVSTLPGPCTQALLALRAIHRADVAIAAVAASQSRLDAAAQADNSHTTLCELVVALDRLELRHRLANHGCKSPWTGCHEATALISGEALLLPMWDDDGAAAWTVQDASPLRSRLFLAATSSVPAVGAPAVVSRAEFERRWQALTGGLFQGFDWRHVVVAGGAVAACLDPSTDVTAPGHPQRPKDVDVFIHGLTPDGAAQVCSEIEVFVHTSTAGMEGYATLLTSRTMTIVFADATMPRLQMVLGHWQSAADVLSTADVDCCCVGYDGHSVLGTARGVLAWTHRVNFGLDSHAAEGCTYEMRLWKYWVRHGFAVAAVAPTMEALEALRAKVRAAGGPKKGGTARALATSAEGLQWVACVEAGLISPVQPSDALDLSGRTLEELCAHIEAVGYVESDNYGSHEEGFVIVRGDTESPTFDVDRTELVLDAWPAFSAVNYFHGGNFSMQGYDPILRADIRAVLIIQNTDVAKIYCGTTWSLDASAGGPEEDR
jgi:hypothetical protein